jgi:hypothetical protein
MVLTRNQVRTRLFATDTGKMAWLQRLVVRDRSCHPLKILLHKFPSILIGVRADGWLDGSGFVRVDVIRDRLSRDARMRIRTDPFRAELIRRDHHSIPTN